MSLLRRATDQQQSEWNPVPEGLWRWIIGVPELKLSEKFGNYQVKFPLGLTVNEVARLLAEHGKPAEGIQQSYRTTYTVGLSLGYVDRNGQYKTTKLIDFLAAGLGHSNARKFREWIGGGGGPPRPDDKDDQKAELEAIAEWLKWWENLEVYGTVSHAADSSGSGIVWSRFAGPMAVGTLPGQKDDDYQALGRGKLRAIIVEAHPELADKPKGSSSQPVADGKATEPVVQFTTDGEQVSGPIADGSAELPF
jgi:hypothetical protein